MKTQNMQSSHRKAFDLTRESNRWTNHWSTMYPQVKRTFQIYQSLNLNSEMCPFWAGCISSLKPFHPSFWSPIRIRWTICFFVPPSFAPTHMSISRLRHAHTDVSQPLLRRYLSQSLWREEKNCSQHNKGLHIPQSWSFHPATVWKQLGGIRATTRGLYQLLGLWRLSTGPSRAT